MDRFKVEINLFMRFASFALAFSQMFNLLCERADNTYGGRLPYHVRVLWDEAANTGQVPGLEKIVAVIRSREISLVVFIAAAPFAVKK